MTDLFDKLQSKVTAVILSKYRSHDLYEDAIQEAHIRLWKDIEDGKTDERHLLNRSLMWGRNFMFDPTHTATGTPPNSRDGYVRAQGAETRKKIMDYINSCDHKPTHREISEATGIGLRPISEQLRRIKNGDFNVSYAHTEKEDGHKRLDKGAYQEVSLDNFITTTNQEPYVSPELEEAASVESFEDSLVHSEAIRQALDSLPDDLKELVFHHIWLDKTKRDVGREMDLLPDRARRKLEKAFKLLRPLLEEHL